MNTQTETVQNFFTSEEWDMIYNFVGNALDNENYTPEDVYSIRAKIHNLFLKSELQSQSSMVEEF